MDYDISRGVANISNIFNPLKYHFVCGGWLGLDEFPNEATSDEENANGGYDQN
jgi:hypothetical protein